MWWFTNLSEIGRSRYFVQPLGLHYILGYDENRIFLTFLKPIGFGNLRFFGLSKARSAGREMHITRSCEHVVVHKPVRNGQESIFH